MAAAWRLGNGASATPSGRRPATGASRRASVARGAAAAATSGEIAAAPAPPAQGLPITAAAPAPFTAATKMAAEDEGEGPVAALLRDGLDAEVPAEPAAALRQSVNTSWDASAERAALRDNLNAYLTREAAAYSGKENQWKNTQGEKSELAATQAKLLREAEELRRREELALVAKRERDAREQDRKRATDEREAALGALSQTLESHFVKLGADEANAARRQEELRARSDEAAARLEEV